MLGGITFGQAYPAGFPIYGVAVIPFDPSAHPGDRFGTSLPGATSASFAATRNASALPGPLGATMAGSRNSTVLNESEVE